MRRTSTSLALVFAASVVAAPVPPPSEKDRIAKYWGTTEGPGEFELNGNQLTLRTKLEPVSGLLYPAHKFAPHTSRAVTGDFEATVKVADANPPNGEAKHLDWCPYTRAGLFVHVYGYTIEIHLFQLVDKFNAGDVLQRCVWADTWGPQGGGIRVKDVEAGQSTHLRLTRKAKAVTVSYSFDGEKWSTPFESDPWPDFPAEVTVGVFFAHSTYQSVSATFGELTIEKPK